MIPKFLRPEVVPYASVEIIRAPVVVVLPVTSITIVPVRPSPHKVICAWCDVVIREGVLPVSHGICPGCRETLEQEIA